MRGLGRCIVHEIIVVSFPFYIIDSLLVLLLLPLLMQWQRHQTHERDAHCS